MEDKRSMGLFYGVMGVATLVVTLIGATFAWFAASATNNAVAGQTGGASLTLSVSKVTTSATGKLVPQLAAGLHSALAAKPSCVDGNSNTVCQVYQIDITNNGSATTVVNGTFTLSSSNIVNLKWVELPTATTVSSGFGTGSNTGNLKAVTAFKSNVSLTASQKVTYYVAVWVEEQSAAQPNDANGSFTGTVTFTGAGGGVTSTFTS